MGTFLHLCVVSEANGRGKLLDEAYGGGKPGLNLDNVRTVLVPLPPAGEQIAVSQFVLQAFRCATDAAEAVAATQDHLSLLDQSILARAFRGELVPQDPNDEPASVLLERIRKASARTARKRTPARGTKRESLP